MTGMVYTEPHQNKFVSKSLINSTGEKKMRSFSETFLLVIFLAFSTHANAGIGELAGRPLESVQIKTVKAKRIDGSPGVEINLGDLVKVGKKSSAFVGNER